VRNLGTVAGSLAHADPQGDWGSVMLAVRAEVVARSSDGERTIPIDELLQGPFTTSLRPNEIITEVRVPAPGQAGGTYLKLERKVGDFATVGVAVHVAMSNGTVEQAGIALTGVGPTSIRAEAAEESLTAQALDDEAIDDAAHLAASAAKPRTDVRGTEGYKRNVVRIVDCPSCGARVDVAAGIVVEGVSAEGRAEEQGVAPISEGEPESFSGKETVEGVMEEIEEKEQS
jgi:carbon-monoxide dehydrogenase medium subunit